MGRQPGVQDDRDIAAAAAFELADDRAAELGRRSPGNPAETIAALPGAKAIIITLAEAPLRISPLIAELLSFDQVRPRGEQAAQMRGHNDLCLGRQRDLPPHQPQRKSSAATERAELINAAPI